MAWYTLSWGTPGPSGKSRAHLQCLLSGQGGCEAQPPCLAFWLEKAVSLVSVVTLTVLWLIYDLTDCDMDRACPSFHGWVLLLQQIISCRGAMLLLLLLLSDKGAGAFIHHALHIQECACMSCVLS